MRRTRLLRYAAITQALLLLQAAGSNVLLAGCTNLGSGFAVFQCGYIGWFAPPPPVAGTVHAVWWQLHYGNGTLTNGLGGGGALEGTGMSSPSTFNGNDSGYFDPVLTQAALVLPQYEPYVPAGALCSNYENSWSQPGVDGCVDNPRTTADDDDILNPYFDATYGTSYCNAYYSAYTLDRQIDYPMAILLTESNGSYFALAAVANIPRGATPDERCRSTSEGFFDLASVVDGDPNPVFPARNNIIPWQPIPSPGVRMITSTDPSDPLSDRLVVLDWSPGVRLVSDQSSRPSTRVLSNPGNGVGVLDQGALVRYVVESAALVWPGLPVDPNTLVWSPVLTTSDTSAVVTVPADSAIRLRIVLGVAPATSSWTIASCRTGQCGDMGFEMTGPLELIPGVLASEEVVDLEVDCARGRCAVTFRTTSELSVAEISLLAVSHRGERLLRSIQPQQGTTGAGASYAVEIGMSDLKGAKAIAVRLEGIGGNLISRSATVPIR